MFDLTATDTESIKANETTKVCQFFVYKQSFTRSKDSNLYCFLSRIETEPTRYLAAIIVRLVYLLTRGQSKTFRYNSRDRKMSEDKKVTFIYRHDWWSILFVMMWTIFRIPSVEFLIETNPKELPFYSLKIWFHSQSQSFLFCQTKGWFSKMFKIIFSCRCPQSCFWHKCFINIFSFFCNILKTDFNEEFFCQNRGWFLKFCQTISFLS